VNGATQAEAGLSHPFAYDFSEEVSSLCENTAYYRPTAYNYPGASWDWDKYRAGDQLPSGWSIALSGLTLEERLDSWSPCTNTLYPLAIKSHKEVPPGVQLIKKLDHTTLIVKDGSFFLALTKSGRDMRWEICNSYARLGFLPPAYFVRRLPRYGDGDREWSRDDKFLLAACRRSLVVVRNSKQRDLATFLDRFGKELDGVRAVVED